MSHSKLYRLFGILVAALCMIAIPLQSQSATKSKPKAKQQTQKERLVLMPLRLGEEDQKLQGAMETALVEGLQQKYEVLSGEQVAKKAREIFQKESRSTAHKECDETRCLQGITEAFQSELLAIASVTKQDGGYFLALSIRNLYDNVDVYSKSLPCRGCDSFQAVEKIKELIGSPVIDVTPSVEPLQPKVNQRDLDTVLWVEAQKGNAADDYQVYIDAFPKGKYLPFAKARIKKLKDEAQALAEQQELQSWDTAQQGSSEDSYALYLKGYPDGRFAGLAKMRLDKLKSDVAVREEAELWKKADSSNDKATVESYLTRFPSGRYIALAKAKLKVISRPANALIVETIGASDHPIAISIVPFGGENQFESRISEVVANDLSMTGLFKLIDPAGKEPHMPSEVHFADWSNVKALSIGNVVNLSDGRIEVRFRLFDTIKNAEILGLAVAAKSDSMRAVAHRISDLIYKKLTNNPGVFSTRIAYVNRQGKHNRILVADSDGYGEQTLVASEQPITSPAWAPDGRLIAYTSFEKGRSLAYVQSLVSGQRILLSAVPEGASAPAWSSDGQQIALASTDSSSSHIYLVRPDGTDLRQITSGDARDDEPNFSPDGKSLIFTSNRNGKVQIYRMPITGGGIEQITSEGDGNFTPRYSKDGKSFVFSHWKGGQFYIAMYDFETKSIRILTPGGVNKKPSFSPNDEQIIFAVSTNGREMLEIISRESGSTLKMYSRNGDIGEPAWGGIK